MNTYKYKEILSITDTGLDKEGYYYIGSDIQNRDEQFESLINLIDTCNKKRKGLFRAIYGVGNFFFTNLKPEDRRLREEWLLDYHKKKEKRKDENKEE